MKIKCLTQHFKLELKHRMTHATMGSWWPTCNIILLQRTIYPYLLFYCFNGSALCIFKLPERISYFKTCPRTITEERSPKSYLGCSGHGASHLHLRVHDLRLCWHGSDFRADGVCPILLLSQLNQLLGENLTCLLVTALCHFLDFCFLEGKE